MNTTDQAPDEGPPEASGLAADDPPAEPFRGADGDWRERPPLLFTCAAHTAGFLAMLGLGWAVATGFLVADLQFNLGMNTKDGDPILPFMVLLALPLIVLSLVAIGIALGRSRNWARRRPYSTMLRANYAFLVAASLIALLA